MEFEEYQTTRPVNEARVEKLMTHMRAEMRADKLRELRESSGISQTELAQRIGVSQNQVSKNITIQRYLEAIGGSIAIDFVVGDQRIRIT